MKKLFSILALFSLMLTLANAQTDKSKKASPPDSVKITTTDGVNLAIHYSQPSLKGRTIGVDVAELGKVWRTGANEASTIAFDKAVTINGENIAAGNYSLYSIPGEQNTTLIFNKVWKQWGTKYDQKQDALRIEVSNGDSASVVEQFTITANDTGQVTLAWGGYTVSFVVKAVK